MKATGIVRRIDGLGRIVIPKEIRGTLRIREGDPLEIFTDDDGGIIFRKCSSMGGNAASVVHYAQILYSIGGLPVLVTDRDRVTAVAGVSRKELLERRVSYALEKLIESRRSYVKTALAEKSVYPVEGLERDALVIYPILSCGDIKGSIMYLKGDSPEPATEAQIKLIQTAAMFLGKEAE